jgi:methionyl-tRNA formyltransferase
LNDAKLKKDVFIFACCKQWQRPYFDTLKKDTDQIWEWASNPEELELLLGKLDPRYIFFSHWNWMVPDTLFNIYECVCFHMTDLPHGRGGSPLQNLIINGHKNTKLTALRMTQELDAGPVYIKKNLQLTGSAQEIYLNAAKLTIQIIRWIIRGNPVPEPQVGEVVTFMRRRPEQSLLPRSNEHVNVYDFIRMLDAEGYPHAFIEYGDFRLEFRQAQKQGSTVIAEVMITLKKSERLNEL